MRSLTSYSVYQRNIESTLSKDSPTTLRHHDPSDLGSLLLIQILPKECALNVIEVSLCSLTSIYFLTVGRIRLFNKPEQKGEKTPIPDITDYTRYCNLLV